MNKRILFGLGTLILAIAGFSLKSANASQAKLQANRIVQQDVAATDTTTARADLKAYTLAHTGASVSFTLTASYNRAQATAQAAASAQVPNAQVYADAQRACSGKSDSITQARCNQQYLASHLVTVAAPATVLQPKIADYQYHFQSPFWAPDLAAAFMAAAAAAFVLTIISLFRKSRRYH